MAAVHATALRVIGRVNLENREYGQAQSKRTARGDGQNRVSLKRRLLTDADLPARGADGIVNLSRGGMLLRSVARWLGAGKFFGRL
jgi:hypothetical protein